MSVVGWQGGGRTAAQTFTDESDPGPEWDGYMDVALARTEAAPLPLAEIESVVDPRDDPDFEPTPPGWRPGDPMLTVERRGPSYAVTDERTGLTLTFREVRTDRGLSADVSVDLGDRRLFLHHVDAVPDGPRQARQDGRRVRPRPLPGGTAGGAITGLGTMIYWPDIDEDVDASSLLRGDPQPDLRIDSPEA